MEPRNRFQGMNSASLCSQAGRYDNPIPPRFLVPIDYLKIPAQISCDGVDYRVPGFLSSRPNWIPRPFPASESCPSFGSKGGAHSLAGKGGEEPIQTKGQTAKPAKPSRINTCPLPPPFFSVVNCLSLVRADLQYDVRKRRNTAFRNLILYSLAEIKIEKNNL